MLALARTPRPPCRRLARLAVVLLALPAAALAQPGTVTGTVTRQATGAPIAGATVFVLDPLGSFTVEAQTDALGAYVAAGVPAGDWWAFVYLDGFLDEFFDALVCEDLVCDFGGVDPVHVVAGGTTSGISFSVLDGSANSISGVVLGENPPDPVSGALVRAQFPDPWMNTDTFTGPNGAFTLSELPAGFNTLYTGFAPPLLDEIYDNVPCPFFACDDGLGTTIEVVTGAPTTGILVLLARGGAIDGTVTRSSDGAPLAFAEVIWSEEQMGVGGNVFTDALGHFGMPTGLPPGDYRFGLPPGATQEARGELFQNLPWPFGRPLSDATPVSVSGTATVAVGLTPPPRPFFADGCETGGTGLWSFASNQPVCSLPLCEVTPLEGREAGCDPCIDQILQVNFDCTFDWSQACVDEVWSTCGAAICS